MTKSTEHSPAPWRYEATSGGRTWGRVLAADGSEVAAAVGAGDGQVIAAAPELVEALLDLAEYAEHDGGCPRHDGSGECTCGLADAEQLVAVTLAKAGRRHSGAGGLRVVPPDDAEGGP